MGLSPIASVQGLASHFDVEICAKEWLQHIAVILLSSTAFALHSSKIVAGSRQQIVVSSKTTSLEMRPPL
jgi:hypothetical protein